MKKERNIPKKYIISGYYGYDNFGDEAILKALISEITAVSPDAEVTVISNSPKKTKALNQRNSVYKYNFIKIFRYISNCNIFISGGGSLIQDKTSFKSLFYYLFLLFTAQISGKKTIVYAQGIGPLKRKLSRLMVWFVLKKTNLITVRDKASRDLLAQLQISSELAEDPVWKLEYIPVTSQNDFLKIGFQLRQWQGINDASLNEIADAVVENFINTNAQINLISLQHPQDTEILKKFKNILEKKGFAANINIIYGQSLEQTIDCIANQDCMISMRYHAALVSAKYSVPVLILSYDPKTEILAKETRLPFINIDDINSKRVSKEIKELYASKEKICKSLKEISVKKFCKSADNIFITKV